MRTFVYICVALWGCVGIVIFVWNMILAAQMMNNRTPKPGQPHLFGPRRFTFQTNTADYTELGQRYRQKAIRTELILLAYVPTLIIAICIASWV